MESSSPQSGSMDGLEEDLGAVAPTETDPATTQLPSTVPSSAVSTVLASSRALRVVHAGSVVPPSVPVPATGQSSNRFAALTEVNPTEEEDPQPARVDEPPTLRLRLMSQVSDIMADQQVSGSDTESIDGASEGEMPVVDAPDSSMPGPFVLGPVVGRRLNEGLASLDLVDLKEGV